MNIVFSYSLSMIPDYESVLAQAQRDLRVGGRLVVLDFADSRIGPIRAKLIRCGVSLGEARTACVRELFRPVAEENFRAWGGLWQYRLLLAERGPRPDHRERNKNATVPGTVP